MKIQLKKNVRYFDADDTDFQIQGKQIKELPEKYLRSYSIKYHLFHGLFEVVEGSMVFHMKAGLVYVAPNTLYCHEYGKYFKKDLEIDTITFINEDEIPKDILELINPNKEFVEVIAKPEVTKEPVITTTETLPHEPVITKEPEVEETKISFDDMTKTQLKAFAKSNNIDLEKSMKVGEIREYLKSLN